MTYLIVGSSSMIAQNLIEQLKQAGSEIITISRSDTKVEGVKRHYVADVTKFDQELPSIEEPISGFIYFPGTMSLKPFQNLKTENFEYDIHINFTSMVRCLEKYLKNLQSADHASIVLISTVAVQLGLPYHTSISAAKGAIEGFARALGAELAPKVRVNVIAPSIVETPLAKPILDRPNQRENSSKRHPLQKIGQPADIAKMAKFLLSNDSDWITGQIFHVDGGISSLRLL